MSVFRYHGKVSVFKIDTAAVGGVQDVSSSFDDGKMDADVDRPDTASFGDVAGRIGVLGLEDNKLTLGGFLKDQLGNRVHGKNTKLWADQYLIGQWLDTAKLGLKVQFDPTPSFNDTAKRYLVPGKQMVDLSIAGKNDFSANALDSIIRTFKAVDPSAGTALPIWSVGVNGTVIGALGFLAQAAPSKMGRQTGEAKIQTVDVTLGVDDQCDFATCLHDYSSVETAAANFTSVNESVATSLGAVAHLHVTGIAGAPAGVIKVQHSTDNSTWVDLIVFTTVTAVTKQRATIASGTTINQYVRCIISSQAGASSMTFVVWFARRGFTYGTAGTLRHFAGLIGGYVNGTLTSSTPLAASAFEFGPAGAGTGSLKLSGNLVLADFSVDFGEEKPTRISMNCPIDGTVTPGTY